MKIRGFRIELGEIENAVSSIAGISQSVVVTSERQIGNANTQYLVAYYVAEREIDQDELTAVISKQLPEYMIPSCFVSIDSMPLTINGKLDRKALPEPQFKVKTDQYVAPRNEIEIKLCDIWQTLLGIEKIGINDDFFRIGGDSILSIQLSSRMRSIGLLCSVKAIFENRTIARLAKHISETETHVHIQSEQGLLSGPIELLPIQRWFFESEHTAPNHWNQSFLVKVPELELKNFTRLFRA